MEMRTWSKICILLHLTVCTAGHLTGRCSLFGRQTIHTFDGVLYDFPGDCSYLLAGDCNHRSFTLLGEFVGGKRTGVTLFLEDIYELNLSVDGLLSQGEKRLSLPYASHSVFVGTELGLYKLWSEVFGFVVTIDSAANIALTLNKRHANRTCGLCGNFNSATADEYTAQEGFLAEDSYDFANSWAMKGADQVCDRVMDLGISCNSSKETSLILSSCSMLQTSRVFLPCAHLVSTEAFLMLCQETVCHCDEGKGQDCYCPILLEYARTCHAHGVVLQGWMEETQCFPRCPVGMQYSECTKSCSTTCHSLHIQEVCKEECVDGCTCPAGKVLDGSRCVEVSECSCIHMGRHFPPGSSISLDCNTCVCRHGSWECTNEGCSGECLVVGQSHFKTFDNKFFTFTEICQYLLARDCAENAFSVIIENVQCADDRDSVCTRSVTLSLPSFENMIVKLKHGGIVSVDGMDIQTPMHRGHLLIQRSVQSSVFVKFGNDFRLDWDGRGRVLLKLGQQWAGRTCGLCGNFNGNQGDDFLTGSGLVEASPQAFGQSWRISADCRAAQGHDIDTCAINPKREKGCSAMMSEPFGACHFLINPIPFRRFCRYDVCACADAEKCLCSALATYAAACASRGVLLNWRSPTLCELECPEGQVYEACGSVCDRTCRSLSGAEDGCVEQRVCEEGCFCPAGKYLSDSGECVTADQCTCLHDGQLYQPKDIYADQEGFCVCENGSMHCSSIGTSNLLSDLFYDDDVSPSRERRSTRCLPPLVQAKCNPGEKGLECARTCQNFDLPCVSQNCISGCLCPPGTVRHHRDCIVPEQCPCYHNNRPYKSGQTITMDCNTCVCKDRKWRCTEKMCDGVCRTVGEGHYITFDGLKYSFPGLCQYVLVQDSCNGEESLFRVLVENDACGILGHRCAKTVSIYYHGGLIIMRNREVRMKRPVPQNYQVEIIRSGQFYTLLLGKDISISWDQGTRLLVHMSASYRGRLCGLCGNFDGNINNDLVSSNNQLEIDSSHFGNSWKVVPSCADVAEIPEPCNMDIVKLVMVEQSCHLLTGPLFEECNNRVDPETYVDMCVTAACSCPSVGDCACFCDAIAAYAQACSEAGLPISWRSNDLCPMSCEELNPKTSGVGEELCQWKYNSCGPSCPITCQHPDPLHCPVSCMEGCHSNCPKGQLLDEVTMRCVDPSECKVCVHEGQKISHGNKVFLNHDDPNRCTVCHCENNTLSCEDCTSLNMFTTPTPTPTWATYTTLPFTTLMPEGMCDRAMDLAFLLDGSVALSEEEFLEAKKFILSIIERFRMGSAHTRATVLLYYSGVKTYSLEVQKWLFKKTVNELKYAGGSAAFLDEAVKYLAVNIYDKNKRDNAGRVAIILTATANPRSVRPIVKMLHKKAITTLTIALGPGVNVAQINDITKANPENRAYILSSVWELPDRFLDVNDYLCTLGMDPEEVKSVTLSPLGIALQKTTTTRPIVLAEPNPTQHLFNTPASTVPAGPSLFTTLPSPTSPTVDLTFIVEGSDSVGEINFNKSLTFVEEVISKLIEKEKEEVIRITIIQYSVTVTVEIHQWELRRRKTLLLERLRQIRLRGGSKTNTGMAINRSYEELVKVQPPQSPAPPQLVFLVTENPPTDTVMRPPSTAVNTYTYPIGVGTKVNEMDLSPFSNPQKPIMIKDYDHLSPLVDRIVNITRTKITPRFPTLPTLPTLPPSVPCKKPMDVLFLLRAGEQFEDMKTFVKAFIRDADIGQNGTRVSVIQYGEPSEVEFTWNAEDNKSGLLNLVDRIPRRGSAAPALGAALRLAVNTAVSPVSGGRVGVNKVVVMLVTDKSTDNVQDASNEALSAGVSVFPIGVGQNYDSKELDILGQTRDNILQLNSMDQLLMLLTLDHGYTEKMCRAGPPRVCVDDNGNQRKPGESWLLEDGCHFVLCNPTGTVTVENHKVSCDRLEPPACRNNIPPVKVQGACSCHWECPCVCLGSSTNHVVRFDSLALRLDGEGLCSYTILTVSRSANEGSEVRLHSGPCEDSANYNHVCMKAMEVTHGKHTLLLKDDMKAYYDQKELALPWWSGGLELVRYGGVMLQLKSDQGYVLTFTPKSNEFTITLSSSNAVGHTSGLCGACEEEKANLLSLRNGSSTPDQFAFVSDWTVAEEGSACLPKPKAVCVPGVLMGCQALRSEVFRQCHEHIPVQVFLAKCEEQVCEESDVCELISAYARLCRQRGVCVDWRSPHLCPFQCPGSMEYNACRTGCVDDCEGLQSMRGDWSVARGNNASCMDTPTEGCFCTGGTVMHLGACIPPEACNECVDQHANRYKYMQTWVPKDNPCLICMCLDQQRINCTARPCDEISAPVCGPCEILKEKQGSKCCPEYECVCDQLNCDLPEVPKCEDGEVAVLKNPGECQPRHECVCKKEDCDPRAPPPCVTHRKLSVRKTKCCDVYECVCSCQNSTRTCPSGFIVSYSTNDCGCTEINCLPDNVCVVGGVAHAIGSEWDEGCERCSCSELLDKATSLHVAKCTPPVCKQTCPLGSIYTPSVGECCGKCIPSSCVEREGQLRGDTMVGQKLRRVGEEWRSPSDKCVLNQCVRVNDEVFISATNVSCSDMDAPSCPLGTELRCDKQDCCPRCHCAPMDVCILNRTLIGAGERMMVDACTRCECLVENGAIKRYKLSCRKTTCSTCAMGYTMQKEADACCGRCVPTACILKRPDGKLISLEVNTTKEEGCNFYTCGVNDKGGLVLQTRITTCPPFNRQECLDQGGKISQIGTSCCETCTEPECRRTVGMLNYIRVDDCQSEQKIELHYCEGKCRSKSIYSMERDAVEQECVCCSAVDTAPLTVPVLCANGTHGQHTIMTVTACNCQSKHCS